MGQAARSRLYPSCPARACPHAPPPAPVSATAIAAPLIRYQSLGVLHPTSVVGRVSAPRPHCVQRSPRPDPLWPLLLRSLAVLRFALVQRAGVCSFVARGSQSQLRESVNTNVDIFTFCSLLVRLLPVSAGGVERQSLIGPAGGHELRHSLSHHAGRYDLSQQRAVLTSGQSVSGREGGGEDPSCLVHGESIGSAARSLDRTSVQGPS